MALIAKCCEKLVNSWACETCCSWEHAAFIVSDSQTLFHELICLLIYCCDCTSQGLEVSIAAPQSPEALLYTSYKQKSDEFRRLFKEVPESEKLIAGETDRGRPRDKKQTM